MSLNELLQKGSVSWHGVKLNQPDWSHYSHSIAFTVQTLSGAMMMHYMLNAFHEALEFELPEMKHNVQWKRWIDTALESPADICYWNEADVVPGKKYFMHPRTVVVLFTQL
jgi:glycogen operon protein